ncbi:multidrug and toxin extrusion protein 1-like [Brachionichthys hirsutus]|uniref:multidrug and toxin extrusion protein 1-like n=1 Tax=Brachionichthys hirsutus TaxID=412623 RepID=UPI003604C192
MEEGPNVKLFCCRWVRRVVPQAIREELYQILRMTLPLLVSRLLGYLLPFVVTMFCGRLGNEVMGGFGLAFAFINITTTSTGYGLVAACDTLVSQTFGGKNLLRVGTILQRGIFILMIFCLPCWALLINAEPILLCLGQDPDVVRIAKLYIIAFLPAVPAMYLHQLQMSYLQNQGVIVPQMFAAAMANIANVVTNYVLIYSLDLGVRGSAAANSLSRIYSCAFIFIVIWWKKLHKPTWAGWSSESLQEWGAFMKLAIPCVFMKCFEWWLYEFGEFFAGMLSEDDLAAQHVVATLGNMIYMIPLAIHAATCARVGNALGAGNTAGGLLTSKVALSLAVGFALLVGIVLASCKDVIGFIFTSDAKIIGLVSNMLKVYCVLQIFDGFLCVCGGIFMGTGKQKIPAVTNLIGYYGIGLSIIVTFIFVIKIGIIGFWLGFLVAAICQSIFFTIVIFKLNWKNITAEAVKRAQKSPHMALLDGAVGTNTADQTVSNGIQADDHVSMSTELDERNRKMQAGGCFSQPKNNHLSATQLIIRRGFTLLVAVALLAVGVSVHFLVPLPEALTSKANFTLDWINTTSTADHVLATVLAPIDKST